MTYYRQSRLRAFLLAAIVAAGAGLHCHTTSNGLFTVTCDEKFSEDDSAFFSLTIKDFRYWW